MTSITIEPTASDAASRSLHVTVPVDRVKAAEDKAVAFYASRARLPGFRPGKAPQAIIRKRFDQAIKTTIAWYHDNEPWWRAIKSGEYLKYYQTQYAGR